MQDSDRIGFSALNGRVRVWSLGLVAPLCAANLVACRQHLTAASVTDGQLVKKAPVCVWESLEDDNGVRQNACAELHKHP